MDGKVDGEIVGGFDEDKKKGKADEADDGIAKNGLFELFKALEEPADVKKVADNFDNEDGVVNIVFVVAENEEEEESEERNGHGAKFEQEDFPEGFRVFFFIVSDIGDFALAVGRGAESAKKDEVSCD